MYLLHSTDSRLGTIYKIGMAINPSNRLRTFDVKLPFMPTYDHLIYTDERRALEKSLHERFKAKLVNGEWYRLSGDDVAFIKSLKGGTPPRVKPILLVIQFGAGAALAILLWLIILR